MLYGAAWLVAIAEFAKDLAWLLYIFVSIRASDQYKEIISSVKRAIVAIALILSIRFFISLDLINTDIWTSSDNFILGAMILVRWVCAFSGILFTHYLYRLTESRTASGFRLVLVALGLVWAYSLNMFSLIILGFDQAAFLSDFRGVFILALFPAFLLAARRRQYWRFSLSRQATSQSLLLVALGSYFVLLTTATRVLSLTSYSKAELFKPMIAFGLAFIILVFWLVPSLRERLKSFVIKNLYEHRYDYRTEWLRFSATISDDASFGLTAEERMIRAVVDITQSRGGALLVAERGERLHAASLWQWPTPESFNRSLPASSSWLKNLADEGSALTLDELRKEGGDTRPGSIVPDWILADLHAWAIVPLVKSGDLVGIILLGRPALDRELDWEDLDLLRVIGRQVAVHLTDAYGQRELEEARRYEEFNKRFAFIIHDLKNVVSQLSLVSANAEEHISNPKFQTAMVRTLENATGKMTTLLSRLSNGRAQAEPILVDVQLSEVVRKLAREIQPSDSICVSIEQECGIRADEELLCEALGHLLRNAIEASPSSARVDLSLTRTNDMAVIAIADHGSGMSAEFIHTQLFKPFSSTKQNGFGIGAAEARDLIRSMDGDLEVLSVEGQGTRVLATFPLASQSHSRSI